MSRGRLLLVEDNRTTAELLRSLLASAGWEVTAAPDAHAALRAALDAAAADVVLADVCLPGGVDGVGLLTVLRTCPGLGRARFVAMTALAGANFDVARRSCEALGFPLLKKPFSADDLHALLRRMAQERGEAR